MALMEGNKKAPQREIDMAIRNSGEPGMLYVQAEAAAHREGRGRVRTFMTLSGFSVCTVQTKPHWTYG